MTDLTRRKILAASTGIAAAGFVAPVSAAEGQPPALSGSIKGGKVELPPLHGPTEGSGAIANPLPPGKRLGVAVVGIGHLSLEQIIPAFGTAKRVKLAALVSSRRDKALAVAAEHGVSDRSVYDYASFDIEAVNGQNDAANGQWRQIKALCGGGSLPDVGIYCLNAFRYITGEEPIEVTGQVTQPKGDPRFREIEDVATFTLRFPSSVLASGSCGYSFHESRQLRCIAADAWFGLDPAFSYNGLVTHIGKKAGDATAREELTRAPKNQFAVEMDAFAEAIATGREPHTPGEEGLQDMKIIAAIYEAAAGGGVVKLPSSTSGLDVTRGPLPSEG